MISPPAPPCRFYRRRLFQPLSLYPLAIGTAHLMSGYVIFRMLASTGLEVAVLNSVTIAAAIAMAAFHYAMEWRRGHDAAPAPKRSAPSHPPPQGHSLAYRNVEEQLEDAGAAARWHDPVMGLYPAERQAAWERWRARLGIGQDAASTLLAKYDSQGGAPADLACAPAARRAGGPPR